MKTIGKYIVEKLKLNSNSGVKDSIISDIKGIINKACKYFNISDTDYNLYLLDNSDNRIMVNDSEDCHVISIFFKKSAREKIEKSKPFNKFIKQIKDKIESYLINYPENIEVKIDKNIYNNIEKIHILIP